MADLLIIHLFYEGTTCVHGNAVSTWLDSVCSPQGHKGPESPSVPFCRCESQRSTILTAANKGFHQILYQWIRMHKTTVQGLITFITFNPRSATTVQLGNTHQNHASVISKLFTNNYICEQLKNYCISVNKNQTLQSFCFVFSCTVMLFSSLQFVIQMTRIVIYLSVLNRHLHGVNE